MIPVSSKSAQPAIRVHATKARVIGASPYVKVKEYLKAGLERGTWQAGQKMPSEADLIGRFAVARMTVNRALKELEAEGLVERRQGSGTYAAELHRVSSALTIRDIHEEILARGHAHRAAVHILQKERANSVVARALELPAGSTVFHSLIVHYENEVAIQCEDRFVNPAVVPDYLAINFEHITPTKYLFDVAPLWKADYAVEAALPTAVEAKLLGISRRDPCLVVARRTHNRAAVITCARLVHPANRYRLEGAFAP